MEKGEYVALKKVLLFDLTVSEGICILSTFSGNNTCIPLVAGYL